MHVELNICECGNAIFTMGSIQRKFRPTRQFPAKPGRMPLALQVMINSKAGAEVLCFFFFFFVRGCKFVSKEGNVKGSDDVKG